VINWSFIEGGGKTEFRYQIACEQSANAAAAEEAEEEGQEAAGGTACLLATAAAPLQLLRWVHLFIYRIIRKRRGGEGAGAFAALAGLP
jgi:hypothetical protein